MPRDEIFQIAAAWIGGADANAVAPFRLRPDGISLLEQAAGIERRELDVEPVLPEQVRDDLIFEAEAGGEDNAARDLAPQELEPFGRGQRRRQLGETIGAVGQWLLLRQSRRPANSGSRREALSEQQDKPATSNPAAKFQHNATGDRIDVVCVDADRPRERNLDLAHVVL